MRKKAESTLISLKLENELLSKLDQYCEQTGLSRTTAISQAVNERLYQHSYNLDQNSLRFLKQTGQWYEWNDYEGNWQFPGCAGTLSSAGKTQKDLPKALQELYTRYYDVLDTGDYKKLVTCKGIDGIAVIWSFSRIYFSNDGHSHEDVDPYIKKTISILKQHCRKGLVLSETGDDGMSDYRIYWFVPGACLPNLEYEDVLDARKTMDRLFASQR